MTLICLNPEKAYRLRGSALPTGPIRQAVLQSALKHGL